MDRNLKGFPLPGAMSAADRVKLEQIMLTALRKLMENPMFKGSYYTLTPGMENTMTEPAYRKVPTKRANRKQNRQIIVRDSYFL